MQVQKPFLVLIAGPSLEIKLARNRIIQSFDREWMDLLWKYRDGNKGTDDDDTTDDEFLNYDNTTLGIVK